MIARDTIADFAALLLVGAALTILLSLSDGVDAIIRGAL